MKIWQLQQAKSQFSELVKRAVNEAPQYISVRGKKTAVILSVEDYQRLKRKKPSLVEFLKGSPLMGVNLSCLRDKSFDRDLDL